MGNKLLSGLHINPIIAAIHHEDALDEALSSQVGVTNIRKTRFLPKFWLCFVNEVYPIL